MTDSQQFHAESELARPRVPGRDYAEIRRSKDQRKGAFSQQEAQLENVFAVRHLA